MTLDGRGILVFLGRSIFGTFEILNNSGASWKIEILQSPPPLNIPTPDLIKRLRMSEIGIKHVTNPDHDGN